MLVGDMYGAPMICSAASWTCSRPGCAGSWRGGAASGTPLPGGLARAGVVLTRSGLAVTGQRYAHARPALGRLAHVRAVLAVRLSLEDSPAFREGRAWWRSERRIRAAAGANVVGGHVLDAKVFWLEVAGSGCGGECWAIEAELTPRPLARTAAIMAGLLARMFGPNRAALLAADLPASAADDRARRDRRAAALNKRLRKIDAAENAHAREIESLAHLDDPSAPAVTALRSRVLARFTELEDERVQISTQLADLAKTSTGPGDPALMDALPLLGDLLADAPARLQQQLYDAFDLKALCKKNMHQVTIHVTITDSTPRAVAVIINHASDHPGSTAPNPASGPVFGFGAKPL